MDTKGSQKVIYMQRTINLMVARKVSIEHIFGILIQGTPESKEESYMITFQPYTAQIPIEFTN